MRDDDCTNAFHDYSDVSHLPNRAAPGVLSCHSATFATSFHKGNICILLGNTKEFVGSPNDETAWLYVDVNDDENL